MKKMNLTKAAAIILGACFILAGTGLAQETGNTKSPWPGEKSTYVSFDMYSFRIGDMDCKIVVPEKIAEGKPWIWRARFMGHEPQTEKALLELGFFVAYVDVADLFGSAKAVARWDAFYKFLTETHGFNKKTVLEGLSRGGLILYNWAYRNPEKVYCIYGDAPVCDFKSWPGIGDRILKAYGLTREEAERYKGNPIDNLKPLADAGVPILHVVGDADKVVPVAENTAVVEKRYKELGGNIIVMHKKGVGHHPHSFKDPKPIVDFILKHSKQSP